MQRYAPLLLALCLQGEIECVFSRLRKSLVDRLSGNILFILLQLRASTSGMVACVGSRLRSTTLELQFGSDCQQHGGEITSTRSKGALTVLD